jgi:FkbM family methyltransferase
MRRKAMEFEAGGKDVHWLFGTLLRDSTHIIALSTPHRSLLINQYPDVEEKCVILPPPPLLRFCADQPAVARQRTREILGVGPDDFVWVFWGYIYPGKGVETLLHAFRIVSQQNTNSRLIVVGGCLEITDRPIICSDYYKMVQRLPETLGIAERVTWIGHFDWDSDEGSRYLLAGDACVMPFDYGVTMNNSTLAAASTYDLPTIATELPVGQDEMLEHGRNIYLCPPRDPELLAEAMQLINDSAELRERLRSGVRELAREWYDWDAMTDRLIGIFETAILACAEHGNNPDPSDFPVNKPQLPDALEKHTQDHLLQFLDDKTAGEARAPLVSVVVAVYKVEKYLSQCLDSLIHQTLKETEIIVVNDASTDNSAEIINDYRTKYPNIRVIQCEHNQGLATVRNIGIRAARGQYIAFIDGDDWADNKMCETMYRRAKEDDADVLIANANVFYENSKSFGEFFDKHIRKSLDAKLKMIPFELAIDPRVLLLEPVAWTKLYKKSFLEKYALQFEDGMNSYEDICFHFSVLVKARRISLIDEVVIFYRQNRPGQISGRSNRKVFEVFDVFDKLREKLYAWEASADIWDMFVRIQLKMFDWLLIDRVQATHKQEFLTLVARQFEMIPKQGLRKFTRQASSEELSRLLCMRKNWLHGYEMVKRQRWPLFPMLRGANIAFYNGIPSLMIRIHQSMAELYRSFVNKSLNLTARDTWKLEFDTRQKRIIDTVLENQYEEYPVVVRKIGDQMLSLSSPHKWDSLGDAAWRMENDYYLFRMVVFREGDIAVDVGAHIGTMSIYLAKRYPFIKVYAIEPDPLNYACLKRNIELNDVKNVIAINKAISGDGRKRRLYTDENSSTGFATIDPAMALSKYKLHTALVDTITLEQLWQECGIGHCRLLKIIAPGAVDESLGGFMRYGCVDLLCGEVDLEDCNRVKLEYASWRIARQHFWRTISQQANGIVYSWPHRIPTTKQEASLKLKGDTSMANISIQECDIIRTQPPESSSVQF